MKLKQGIHIQRDDDALIEVTKIAEEIIADSDDSGYQSMVRFVAK